MNKPILVNVVTDGMGSFHADCKACNWTSKWFEFGSTEKRNAAAIECAKEHGAMHAAVEQRDALAALLRECLNAWEGTGPGIVLDRIRAALEQVK